jgi:uncharacterized membrane protein YcaP (DUF421 family)
MAGMAEVAGIWNDMLVSGVPVAEKVIRTVAVYAFLVAGLRVFGKRELGQLNPLDVIVLVEGRPDELVRDGHVIDRALAHNQITREELVAAARKQGIEHMGDVACARLEVSGAVSFLVKEPTELQRFHSEIVTRLEAIERKLAAPQEKTPSASTP